MRYLLFPLFVFFITCSNNPGVSKKLSGCDSLVVNFYAPQSQSVIRSVATGEKKAINRISEFVSAKETEAYKCGYDGNLLFFEKGKLVSDVSFKYTDAGCRHFLLDADGKLNSTKMSNEAADLLKGLAEGSNWY